MPRPPITADILGGFRDRVGGLVSAVIFLEQKKGPIVNGKPSLIHYARCLESMGKRAKNRYGLPEVVDDISYQTLVKATQQGGK